MCLGAIRTLCLFAPPALGGVWSAFHNNKLARSTACGTQESSAGQSRLNSSGHSKLEFSFLSTSHPSHSSPLIIIDYVTGIGNLHMRSTGTLLPYIDYVTGIGNAYWLAVSVSPARAHLQSFLAQPPPALTPMPLSCCLELLPSCVMF